MLDAHTGARCKADKAHLTVAVESKGSPKAPEEGIKCLVLIVGAKGARCLADLSDERIARVEWGHKAGNVVHAQVVERNGSGTPCSVSYAILSNGAHFRISRTGGFH